jgi:imidazoleglycerol-phosphate dehydratase
MNRTAKLERKTNETEITLELNLDGAGKYKVNMGIPFFNHMLELFTRSAMVDLQVTAKGDLEHHIVEDVGIVLGQVLKQAIGDKKGIRRYGFFLLPMDESLVRCALDWCNRGNLVFACDFKYEKVEGMTTDLIQHFFKSVAENAGLTLNLCLIDGENEHHKAEALFKAFGKVLRIAMEPDPRMQDKVPSTKGTI